MVTFSDDVRETMVRLEIRRTVFLMFTVVAPTTSLSLDAHFFKRPASTFFVAVEGDGMAGEGILAGDTLVVDRSRTPRPHSIVVNKRRNPAVNLKNLAVSSTVSACGGEGAGLGGNAKTQPAPAVQEVSSESV